MSLFPCRNTLGNLLLDLNHVSIDAEFLPQGCFKVIQVQFGCRLLGHECAGLAFGRLPGQAVFLIEFGLLGYLRFERIDFCSQFAIAHLGLLQLLGNAGCFGLALAESIGLLAWAFLLFQPINEPLLQIAVGLLCQVEGGYRVGALPLFIGTRSILLEIGEARGFGKSLWNGCVQSTQVGS